MIDKELDEIIFAKREKNYGAFYLRRMHRWFLLLGLWFAIILVCVPVVLMFLPYLSSHEIDDIKTVTLEEFNHLDSLDFIPPPPMQQVELESDAKRFVISDTIKKYTQKDKPILVDSTKTASDTTQIGNNDGVKKNVESFYVYIEQMPEFPGGPDAFNRYITMKLDLTSYLKAKNLSGTVTVSFTINKLGAVTDVKIVNSLDSIVDNAVLSLFQTMPNWKPATTEGKPVKIQFVMPVNVSAL